MSHVTAVLRPSHTYDPAVVQRPTDVGARLMFLTLLRTAAVRATQPATLRCGYRAASVFNAR